jgi:hypothetical protein
VEWKDGKMVEVPGSEQVVKADLVLLAMGFVNPVATVLEQFGVEKDGRGNARATPTLLVVTRPAYPRFLPLATCAAASRWSSGPSGRAVRQHERWMNS